MHSLPPHSATLAQKFGPVRQLAYVPRDFDGALRFWTRTLGVGPFFYIEHIPLVDVCYRGQPTGLDCSAALAFWGDLEIELLRQHDDRASLYREWTDSGRQGVHHIRVSCNDLNAARAWAGQMGAEVAQEARMPNGGHYIMVDLRDNGPFVEFAELHPSFIEVFAHIKDCSTGWDGSDPVRRLPGDTTSRLPAI